MNRDLKMGSTGEDVIILQERLKKLGLYNALVNGSFGLATLKSVEMFQKLMGLNISGVVDDKTNELLKEYTEPKVQVISNYPTLKKGSTGSYVTDLQTKLKALLYFNDDIDGIFGEETENAVKRFQLNNGLTSDGIVGNSSWNAINSSYGNISDCALDNGNKDEYETYKVQSGDTLYSIAMKYNTTVSTLKELNNLTSDLLSIGQILKVPLKEDNNYLKYTIEKGDTLYSIAKKYNTTVSAIMNLNNLNSTILRVGDVLLIPSSNQNYIEYVVKSGDTLYRIAINYKTTVDDIKRLNNLNSNNLQIGQVLKIPLN